MKKSKILKIKHIIIPILLLIIFIFIYDSLIDNSVEKKIDYHASLLEGNIWNVETKETENILNAIIQSNDFKEMKVYAYPNNFLLAEVNKTPYENEFERILYNINLINTKNLTKNVERNNEIIGRIDTIWINKNIYAYLYFFIIVISIYFVIYSYFKIKKQKKILSKNNIILENEIILRKKAEKEIINMNKNLEKRVEDRTKDLNDLNVKLKKEIEEKLEAQNQLEKNNDTLESLNEELKAMNEELEAMYIEQTELSNKLEKIIHLTSHLIDSATKNDESFLSDILELSLSLVKEADCGSVVLFEDKYMRFVDSIGHNQRDLNDMRIPLENLEMKYFSKNKYTDYNIFLEAIKTKQETDKNYEKLKQAFKNIKHSTIIYIETPQKKSLGVISLDITKEKINFSKESEIISKAFSSLSSAFLTIRRYLVMEEKISKATILSMIRLLEIHDTYTQGHSERVAETAVRIGIHLNMNQEELKNLHWTGIIHDIGKILVPISVLNKPGKLTKEEFTHIKKHPEWGYEVLKNSDITKELGKNILHHHERWDGKGYPHGLKGEEIPLISRILTIADAFDAMISKRSYKKEMNIKEALNEIKSNSGTQFDPKISELFLKLYENDKNKA